MMKQILTGLLAILFCGCLFAAEKPFEISNIVMKMSPTPIPKYTNINSISKSSSNNRWLKIVTTFVPEAISTRGNSARDPWYDDVTMEGTLVITRYVSGKADSYVVLTGKTRYFTINADGKEHNGCFYVPPKLLERYCGIGNVEKSFHMARVAFYGPGRVLLGEGYWAMEKSGKKGQFLKTGKIVQRVAARMKEFEKNYSDVIVLRGGLYSKEKTPWHHVDYDFFDLIYENILQQDSGNIKK